MRWSPRLSRPRLLVVAGLVLALGLLGWGSFSLSAPVERAGRPTIPVTPPPPRSTASTTPTSSASPGTDPSASASALPSVLPIPKPTLRATGRYTWSSLTVPPVGTQGTLHTYTVAVENSSKLKPNSAAALVAATLNDPRSWTGSGTVRFGLLPSVVREDVDGVDFVLYLASGKTAARICGSAGAAAYSCVSGTKVVVNVERWMSGSPTYAKDLEGLRRFLVNNAVGQFLGKKPATCSKAGRPAPVMLQQAAGLGGCIANPWPNA